LGIGKPTFHNLIVVLQNFYLENFSHIIRISDNMVDELFLLIIQKTIKEKFIFKVMKVLNFE